MLKRVLRICAWLCLAYIIFVTLGPIEFRPGLIRGQPNIDRFAAYLVVATLLAWAYPRYFIATSSMIGALAISLEALQLLTPGRHGRLEDLQFKLLGIVVGFAFGATMLRVCASGLRASQRERDERLIAERDAVAESMGAASRDS